MENDDMPDLIEVSPNSDKLPEISRTGSSSCSRRALLADSDNESDDPEDYITDDAETAEQFYGCQTTLCLVCSVSMDKPDSIIEHMTQAHQFDLVKICVFYHIDQILFIKLINYIRRNESAINDIRNLKFDVTCLDDSYMVQSLNDDPLLRFDIELYLDELRECGKLGAPSQEEAAAVSLSCIKSERDQLIEDNCKMKEVLMRFLDANVMSNASKKEVKVVGDRDLDNDAGYFDSYSDYSIHHEMLSDRVRTDAYRDAICSNPGILSGARVLDLGCGTGILSIFCAKTGAKRVDAVDMAEVAFDAMEIVKINQLDSIVHVTKGRLEDQSFPDKFDIIVSEWMGYFLLFEGMLDSVIAARDRFLKPGGVMMPNRCTMHISALDDSELFFWDDVYGYDMSCIGKKMIKEASTIVVRKETVATNAVQIAEFDINKCSTGDTQFSSLLSLEPSRSTALTALAGYFDTYFDLPTPVMFSTGPLAPPTHWRQTVFILPQPLHVTQGRPVTGSIAVKRHTNDVRALEVSITLEGATHHYTVQWCLLHPARSRSATAQRGVRPTPLCGVPGTRRVSPQPDVQLYHDDPEH